MPRYGGYGGYAQPQSAPGYDPYSKNFQWGTAFSGIQEIIQQLAMMKKMKEQEKEEAIEKEWTRGQREYDLYLRGQEEERKQKEADQPPKPSAKEEERQMRMSHGLRQIKTGAWSIDEALTYRDTGEKPLREQTAAERAITKARTEGTKAGGGGTGELTPYQKSTQDRMERNTMLSSIEHSLGSITTMFSDADKGALTGMTSDIDYKSLKKSRAELNRFRAKLLGGNKLSDTELTEATRIMTDPSAAFPTAPIKDVGGAVGQVLGGQGKPAGVLPPEVTEYIKKHPDVSPEQAMKLYLKWKQSR